MSSMDELDGAEGVVAVEVVVDEEVGALVDAGAADEAKWDVRP